MGRPSSSCSTFARPDRMRVPWPAARITHARLASAAAALRFSAGLVDGLPLPLPSFLPFVFSFWAMIAAPREGVLLNTFTTNVHAARGAVTRESTFGSSQATPRLTSGYKWV